MRIFKTEVKDDKTGYSVVLSECSYNMACDWLSRELGKYNYEIVEIARRIKDNLLVITTESTRLDFDVDVMLDGPIHGSKGRTFYYDEERGYLLGE